METVLRGTGKETVIGPGRPFCIIGERINPTGKKRLTRAIREADWSHLQRMAVRQVEAGIEREKIIVDPGVGFGKNPDQNLELVDRLGELRALGRPILVGVSRKSFVAHALGGAAEGRAWGTAAAVAVSIMRGADIVRVHDVREMAQVARVTDRIVRRSVR